MTTQTTATVLAGMNASSNRIAVRPPTLTGINSWVFPRTSPTPANLISGGPAITAIGTGPVLQTAWGNFTRNTAAYDSGIVDTTVGTLMAVALSPGGSGGYTLFSNYSPGGIDFYIDLYNNGIGLNVSGSMYSTEVPVTSGSILQWGFYAVTWGPAGITINAPTVGLAKQVNSTSIGGTPANGSTISVTATGSFSGSPHTTTYTLTGSDTTATAATGLMTAINADSVMTAAGILAGVSATRISLCTPIGSGITFTVGATGALTNTYLLGTTAHTINSAQTYKIGSTVSGNGAGSGSTAWWGAATGTGSQATQAQILQTYAALQASLAIDGISI
jgi:hypothetical protein